MGYLRSAGVLLMVAAAASSIFLQPRMLAQLTMKSASLLPTTRTALSITGGATATTGAIMRLNNYIGESKFRSWVVLIFSIVNEIVSITILNMAQKEKHLGKLVFSLGLYLVSLLGFATCLAQIDVSIAYAVWSALGTAIVSVVGIVCFGENADPMKMSCISLILLGVVGLNLSESGSSH